MATAIGMRPHGAVTRAIHWGTALLVLETWVIGSTMEEFPRGGGREFAAQVHYSLGVLVLGAAALRVAWRALSPPPRIEGSPWQRRAAQAMHLVLLLLTLLLPISGLFDRWARGRGVMLLGEVPLPAPFPVPGGKLWGEAHEVLADLLLVAVAAHVLAALWHHFVLRDGTLARMAPVLRRHPAAPSGG